MERHEDLAIRPLIMPSSREANKAIPDPRFLERIRCSRGLSESEKSAFNNEP
jgi:hypothetical protein